MQVELSEKEIEIIINMLTESLNKVSDGKDKVKVKSKYLN